MSLTKGEPEAEGEREELIRMRREQARHNTTMQQRKEQETHEEQARVQEAERQRKAAEDDYFRRFLPRSPPPAAKKSAPDYLLLDVDDDNNDYSFVVRELNRPPETPVPYQPPTPWQRRPLPTLFQPEDMHTDSEPTGSSTWVPPSLPLDYSDEADDDSSKVAEIPRAGVSKRRRRIAERDEDSDDENTARSRHEALEEARRKAINENRSLQSSQETRSQSLERERREVHENLVATAERSIQFGRSLQALISLEERLRQSQPSIPPYYFLVANGFIRETDGSGRAYPVESVLRIEPILTSLHWSELEGADQFDVSLDITAKRMPILTCRFRLAESQALPPPLQRVQAPPPPPPFDTLPWPVTVERDAGSGGVDRVSNPSQLLVGDVVSCHSQYLNSFDGPLIAQLTDRLTRDTGTIRMFKNILMPQQTDENLAIIGSTRTPFTFVWVMTARELPPEGSRAAEALFVRQ